MTSISYVMCTKNRGAIFQSTLEDLIQAKREHDEIVVVNGGSDPAMAAWLEARQEAGEVETIISGKDRNQAHGWNRGFLAARGEFIKKITDDDVFDYTCIRECASYMKEHPECDLVISNELFTDLMLYPRYDEHIMEASFHRWRKGESESFFFPDPHLLIRRSSLPILGLFATGVKLIDYEWSLRVSSTKAGIAYFTGCNSMTFWHRATVTGQMQETEYFDEYQRLDRFYRNRANPFRPWHRRLIKWRSLARRMLRPRHALTDTPGLALTPSHLEHMRSKLAEHNRQRTHRFLS